jgi:hypothetical protein
VWGEGEAAPQEQVWCAADFRIDSCLEIAGGVGKGEGAPQGQLWCVACGVGSAPQDGQRRQYFGIPVFHVLSDLVWMTIYDPQTFTVLAVQRWHGNNNKCLIRMVKQKLNTSIVSVEKNNTAAYYKTCTSIWCIDAVHWFNYTNIQNKACCSHRSLPPCTLHPTPPHLH